MAVLSIVRCFLGSFHTWGYPNSWVVYNGKTESNMDDLKVPVF